MNKSGITMASLVIYVVLFFAFSTFAISISSNMNYSTLSEKGDLWVNEQYEKLQYNLLKSAKASDEVYSISGKLIFSNNDEYFYDTQKNQILKNGGVIASDVNGIFEITANGKNCTVNVSFLKYEKTKTGDIFVTVGDDIDE